MRAVWFIVDCIGNAVVVLGIPIAWACELINNFTGWMRHD